MNRAFLLYTFVFVILCATQSRAQELSSFDASVGVGVMGQFSKLINESFDAGPAASVALGYRPQKNSRFSLQLEYLYMHSSFSPGLSSREDAEVRFASLNLRFDLETHRGAWAPYLIIGFGTGGVAKKILSVPWDTNSPWIDTSYTGTTAINVGVGFHFNIWERSALFTQLRFVIGEDSGVSIPLQLGYKYEW